LTALESIVNKKDDLKILVHTRDDILISVDPKTRIMRNYERFLGLMEQLFEKQIVPDKGHPLLTLERDTSLKKILEQQHADVIIALSKDGAPVELHEFFRKLQKQKKQDILCIIGGFPSGTFHVDLTSIATDIISLFPEMLPAWTVASELLVNYGNIYR
jgi:rRNA small subunit pseudouridine methyltransferase Nep1